MATDSTPNGIGQPMATMAGALEDGFRESVRKEVAAQMKALRDELIQHRVHVDRQSLAVMAKAVHDELLGSLRTHSNDLMHTKGVELQGHLDRNVLATFETKSLESADQLNKALQNVADFHKSMVADQEKQWQAMRESILADVLAMLREMPAPIVNIPPDSIKVEPAVVHMGNTELKLEVPKDAFQLEATLREGATRSITYRDPKTGLITGVDKMPLVSPSS